MHQVLPLDAATCRSAVGCMLETPLNPAVLSLSHPRCRVSVGTVTIRPVRTISRKGQAPSSGSSGSSTARAASRSRWCETPGACSAGKSSTSSRSPKPHPRGPHSSFVSECGQIIENRRNDNHRHPLLRFSVKRRSELTSVIVPLFEQHPLITAKRADFVAFASVLRMMEEGVHLTGTGYVGSLSSQSR